VFTHQKRNDQALARFQARSARSGRALPPRRPDSRV